MSRELKPLNILERLRVIKISVLVLSEGPKESERKSYIFKVNIVSLCLMMSQCLKTYKSHDIGESENFS